MGPMLQDAKWLQIPENQLELILLSAFQAHALGTNIKQACNRVFFLVFNTSRHIEFYQNITDNTFLNYYFALFPPQHILLADMENEAARCQENITYTQIIGG